MTGVFFMVWPVGKQLSPPMETRNTRYVTSAFVGVWGMGRGMGGGVGYGRPVSKFTVFFET